MKARVYVVGRHRWRGISIGVCQKGVVETVGERPKKGMCAMDRMLREGEARRACACTSES